MEAPVITRRRRPFLMPIWLMALIVCVPVALAVGVYRSATTTTVVVVRHAEKVLGTISDPPLTMQGEQRAQQLARMFGGVRGTGQVDAVYVANARRAQQTVAPLLDRLRTRPILVEDQSMKQLATRILREQRGGVALVVGSANTIPELIRELSGVDVGQIAEEEYDNLFIVSIPTLGDASVVRMKY